MYKTAALQKILVGQAKVDFDLCKSEGWSYDALTRKLKETARSKKLGKEAGQGKPAAGLKKVQVQEKATAKDWGAQDDDGVEINALKNVWCFQFNKKWHY